MRIKIFIFFLIFAFSFPAQAQTFERVIKKYVEFIGGKKKWKKVKTMTTSGEYNYGGIAFPFSSYAKVPNLYKFVVTSEGKYYAQGFDGIRGWKIDAFKNETTPTLLNGKAALAMANEADVELENVFIDYLDKGYQAIMEGKDTIQGNVCIKIKLIRKNEEVETYYFKDQTFELIMKRAASKNAELEGTQLTIFYSDYRDVEGIKIPFKTITESNGQIILTITINKAEVNTPIEDREFQP
jgi:hypothetical protein